MLRRLNKVLPELILGILLYGIVLQAAGIWLSEDKLMYTKGLWIGIILAMGLALHIAVVIEDAVSLNSSRAKLVTMSLLRYIAAAAVLFGTAYFRLGSVIAAFLGVMGLKIAAYSQPFIHKVILKLKGSEEELL